MKSGGGQGIGRNSRFTTNRIAKKTSVKKREKRAKEQENLLGARPISREISVRRPRRNGRGRSRRKPKAAGFIPFHRCAPSPSSSPIRIRAVISLHVTSNVPPRRRSEAEGGEVTGGRITYGRLRNGASERRAYPFPHAGRPRMPRAAEAPPCNPKSTTRAIHTSYLARRCKYKRRGGIKLDVRKRSHTPRALRGRMATVSHTRDEGRKQVGDREDAGRVGWDSLGAGASKKRGKRPLGAGTAHGDPQKEDITLRGGGV
ncbi:hypothetical protein B0H16DRAFT_1453365 [Mycena metata]|uniref:Uncharacterized protein n=1 Tax=Mycena metata TaxID=1033252 RepID=A0AAD7JPC1_9AGAR|nr:hypothetical protein B0H16DRAFT_1453365 [Mycena metata]